MLTKLRSAWLSGKYRTVCIICNKTLCDKWFLYVGLVQIATFVVIALKRNTEGIHITKKAEGIVTKTVAFVFAQGKTESKSFLRSLCTLMHA